MHMLYIKWCQLLLLSIVPLQRSYNSISFSENSTDHQFTLYAMIMHLTRMSFARNEKENGPVILVFGFLMRINRPIYVVQNTVVGNVEQKPNI